MSGSANPKRMRMLLSRTLRRYVYCAFVVLFLITPVFYVLTKQFYAEDLIDIIESVNRGQGIPPLDLERDIIAGVTLQFLLVSLAVTVAMFITVRFITRKLWLPFDDTLKKTEQFNLAQDELPQFMETDISEFNRLNNSLKQLMERSREAFRIQKEFTENASHELQTPLAIIRGKLDLLMQENMNEQQMKLVSDLYQLTMRMSHLSRNLLMLAKIDNAQYKTMEEVNVKDLLDESLPMYDVLLNGTTIQLRDERKRRKKIRANQPLLESLLKNLIVNAIRHSSAGGIIEIVLKDDRLVVTNTASDTEGALDASMLFRRFRSGDVEKKGNGLGLAIVKSVCDFHGWEVGYDFNNGKHCFSVLFRKPV